MFVMSPARRLISAGDPAPSQTTTSNRARNPANDSATTAPNAAVRARYDTALTCPATRPRTTTCDDRSLPGLSNTGLNSTLGANPHACACIACARPISPPSTVTTELLLMFCALNGATDTPRRHNHRHNPATTALLPASDDVPATSNAPRNPGSDGAGTDGAGVR
ncbi:hypothetical protein GCM10023403_43860 [Pseudonocardia benzenivorans]|nr:hypothetical protein PSD17_07540 [Pseudonocardia sp. D17]